MLAEFPTVWESNCPLSLVDIAIHCCLKNQILLKYSSVEDDFGLRDNISLPREICERLIHIACLQEKSEPCRSECSGQIGCLLKVLKDPIRTRLSQVNLSGCSVFDKDLEIVCRHNISELNISQCPNLTDISFTYLNRLKPSLLSLTIGTSINVFPQPLYVPDAASDSGSFSPELYCRYSLDTPNLRKLVVEGTKPTKATTYFYYSVKKMEYLLHLDLSRCQQINNLEFLRNHRNLVKLILFAIPDLEKCIDAIRTIPTLRYLDLSQVYERCGYYRNPNKVLKSLVQSLPNLVWLDLSGTNLAGDRIQERDEVEQTGDMAYVSKRLTDAESSDDLVSDIPGLKSRVNRPLEFLGLFKTAYEACYRHHIPATRIAGEANHDQILTAGQAYSLRPEIIRKVLDDLFHVFRFSQCDNVRLALDVIMEAMKQHLDQKQIQISGSASLFYIVKSEEKNLNMKIKKTIVKTLLDAMITHISDVTMIRNGCLTLIHFKIPEDFCFEYDRLVNLLLSIIAQEDQDEFVQRIGVYLLNSFACQVEGRHKQSVGNHGTITVMLQIISSRLANEYCDEVMETAWSTLWNVTDETPINSQRFLEGDGMSVFLKCLRTFPDKPELLRNMMGLLGNVAEVRELRRHLMTDEYLSVFSDLLTSKSDGIEVSYNAAGILSHIMSDGHEIWEQHNISALFMEAVRCRMVQAIESWNLNAKRNINYRSFEPILRLLYINHAPEAQYWATWALANLTKVYPEKYCPLLRDEGGLPIIEKLAKQYPLKHIQDLACMIIQHNDWNTVKTTLDTLSENKSDAMVIRTCCSTLKSTDPKNLLVEFDRLVNLLLDIADQENQDDCVQLSVAGVLALVILNSDSKYRELFGSNGGIMTILQLISNRLSRECWDDVMDTFWEILWNATDGTPVNCRRFIERHGVTLFQKCFQACSNKQDLVHKMMGTLGNVVEVKELSAYFLSEDCLTIISNLSSDANFEISYHAIAMLAYLVVEGVEVWKRHNLSTLLRERLCLLMVQTIERWDLGEKRTTSYRSFEPVLRLLCVDQVPEAQYWAAWALANLTKVYPDRYCPLLRDEGGLPIIKKLLAQHPLKHVRDLCRMVVQNCNWWDQTHDDLM